MQIINPSILQTPPSMQNIEAAAPVKEIGGVAVVFVAVEFSSGTGGAVPLGLV